HLTGCQTDTVQASLVQVGALDEIEVTSRICIHVTEAIGGWRQCSAAGPRTTLNRPRLWELSRQRHDTLRTTDGLARRQVPRLRHTTVPLVVKTAEHGP